MDNAQVQDILDDFVVKNESNFDRVSNENPILYNAVIDALDFLSNRFGTGKNIPQKELTQKNKYSFNVGDYFIYSDNPSMVFKIVGFKDNDNIVEFVDSDKGDDSFRFGTGVFEAINNIASGKIVKVEPKSETKIEDLIDLKVSVPKEEIKVGDLFQDTADDKTIFKVSDIEGGDVDFVKTWDDNFAFTFDKDKVRKKVSDGKWRKVTELEVFDILYPKKTSVKKPKKTSLSKEIKELKEAIEGLEAVESYLEDDEKKELAELRQKLSDLQQKNS